MKELKVGCGKPTGSKVGERTKKKVVTKVENSQKSRKRS